MLKEAQAYIPNESIQLSLEVAKQYAAIRDQSRVENALQIGRWISRNFGGTFSENQASRLVIESTQDHRAPAPPAPNGELLLEQTNTY